MFFRNGEICRRALDQSRSPHGRELDLTAGAPVQRKAMMGSSRATGLDLLAFCPVLRSSMHFMLITSYGPLILSVAGQCAHLRILADPLSACVCDVRALQREGMDRAIGRSTPLPSLRFQRDRAERRQGDRRIA